MANLYFIAPVLLLLTFFMQDGEPLRCWFCSSDLNPLCNDPFQAGQDPHHSYIFRLVNCDVYSGVPYPYLSSSSKSACIKKKTNINGQNVTIRGCTWKRHDDNSSFCPSTTNGAHIVTTFCKTCDYDACNGV